MNYAGPLAHASGTKSDVEHAVSCMCMPPHAVAGSFTLRQARKRVHGAKFGVTCPAQGAASKNTRLETNSGEWADQYIYGSPDGCSDGGVSLHVAPDLGRTR